MVLAVIIAPFLGIDKKGGFQYIQEYTGFVSPGIFAMFLLGFFWKKTTSNAALFATIGGFLLSVFFKFLPQLYSINFAVPNAEGIYEIPFIDRMAIVFLLCVTGMALISFYEIKKGIKPQGLEIDKKMFKMQPAFLVGALIVCGILAALYIRFW